MPRPRISDAEYDARRKDRRDPHQCEGPVEGWCFYCYHMRDLKVYRDAKWKPEPKGEAMADVSRAEHLKWCKERALAYLPTNPQEAFTSMASDLGKHPETTGHAGIELGMMLLLSGNMKTDREVRDFIEGFN